MSFFAIFLSLPLSLSRKGGSSVEIGDAMGKKKGKTLNNQQLKYPTKVINIEF